MSETSTPDTEQKPRQRVHPAEFLLELIITLMTPMFLAAAAGDLAFARAAAAETLAAYRAETQNDLITVAKIIAFGLVTLASLSRSMDDDLTLNQILRLRSNANATDRSEERCRQTLGKGLIQQAAEPSPEPDIDTAALLAAATRIKRETAENLAKFAPKPPQDPNSPPAPAPKTQADKHYSAIWAASAAHVAAETAASIDTMPPGERENAAMWVGVLNDIAKEFTVNGVPPRPKPGELASLFRGG